MQNENEHPPSSRKKKAKNGEPIINMTSKFNQ